MLVGYFQLRYGLTVFLGNAFCMFIILHISRIFKYNIYGAIYSVGGQSKP
nr:MAG TPA: hypothetical protein [Siphoviridae sp. ctELO16]